MNSIRGITPQLTLPAVAPAAAPQPAAGAQPFKDFLIQSIGHVNNMQADADKAVQQLLTGGDVNPAEVLTTIQKSDMTFKMMMQIRNKLVQAFQEVNNIRI